MNGPHCWLSKFTAEIYSSENKESDRWNLVLCAAVCRNYIVGAQNYNWAFMGRIKEAIWGRNLSNDAGVYSSNSLISTSRVRRAKIIGSKKGFFLSP